MTFSELVGWGLDQEVMKDKVSAGDDVMRLRHLVIEFGSCKAGQIKPLMVDNFRVKMFRTVSESTGKPYSGSTINKMVSLARRIYFNAIKILKNAFIEAKKTFIKVKILFLPNKMRTLF